MINSYKRKIAQIKVTVNLIRMRIWYIKNNSPVMGRAVLQ